jgi:hypothetical protein
MYMTLIMGGAMIVIMLGYMLGMYKNRTANLAIFAGGILLIFAAVGLVRSQATVSDVDYMEGMIPHHSIAILTSERAGIEDARVRVSLLHDSSEGAQPFRWLLGPPSTVPGVHRISTAGRPLVRVHRDKDSR